MRFRNSSGLNNLHISRCINVLNIFYQKEIFGPYLIRVNEKQKASPAHPNN